jgi:hypothetical protein
VVLTALLSTTACQGQGGAVHLPDAEDAGHDRRIQPPNPEYQCEPNLSALQSGIFERGCAFIICHTSAGYAGSLDLTETNLQEQLVGADAVVCPGWKRVVPGSPETSFLWNKLTQHTPSCGIRMPWGIEPLPRHALDCVLSWILALPGEQDAGPP